MFCSSIDPSFIFAQGDSFEKGKSVFWALKREFCLEFCYGWPLVICVTSCKVQMFYASSFC